MISGDAGRLQQVVWNLLSNAVKFTPEGGQIVITLSNWNFCPNPVHWHGQRHSSRLPALCLEHFRQEDGATTRKFGLGLGLAIVRQIVELRRHGSSWECWRWATRPLPSSCRCWELKLETLAEPIPALPPLSALLLNVQVLVVDDEADTRELTAFVLEQVGAIVTAVPSAIEALEVFAQSQPDVLVSDIGMPEMDGYALMRQIRQLPEQVKPIPAVALTAYAEKLTSSRLLPGSKVTCPSLLTQMPSLLCRPIMWAAGKRRCNDLQY